MTKDEAVRRGLARVIFTVGLIASATAIILFAYQCVLWLQDGHWTQFAVRDANSLLTGGPSVADPGFAWRGIDKITIVMLEAPLSFCMWFVGMALITAGIKMQVAKGG